MCRAIGKRVEGRRSTRRARHAPSLPHNGSCDKTRASRHPSAKVSPGAGRAGRLLQTSDAKGPASYVLSVDVLCRGEER